MHQAPACRSLPRTERCRAWGFELLLQNPPFGSGSVSDMPTYRAPVLVSIGIAWCQLSRSLRKAFWRLDLPTTAPPTNVARVSKIKGQWNARHWNVMTRSKQRPMRAQPKTSTKRRTGLMWAHPLLTVSHNSIAPPQKIAAIATHIHSLPVPIRSLITGRSLGTTSDSRTQVIFGSPTKPSIQFPAQTLAAKRANRTCGFQMPG